MRLLLNDFCGHPFQIELSRELARRGHEVLHLYFADNDTTPKGNLRSGGRGCSNIEIEGLHIPIPFSKHSLWSRRRADVAYGNAVAARVASFKPDVVISANMPLDAQRVLQDAARLHDAKFVFWLQDIYSSAVKFVLQKKIGPFANIVAMAYERLEKRLLSSSDAVVSIAPSFSRVVAAWGVVQSRSFVIENWAPLGEVVPTAKANAWSREQGLDSKFCFVYSGTLGMKHRPELLLALAQHLETRKDACLVVVSAGAGTDWLREHSQLLRKGVLRLLPFQPYDRLSEVLGTADVLVSLLSADAGAFAVPSKTLSYLCAGRTLICAAPRENHAATIVERGNVGVVVSPDSTTDIVSAAQLLMDNPALRSRYGSNARAYAERSFDVVPIADRFLEVIARAEKHGTLSHGGVSAADVSVSHAVLGVKREA
jgi:colanic acid biosynthesis glycosyl transferase WcaI